MKVGLLITGLTAADTVRAAQAAERHGLNSCWIVEDLWNRGAVPLATACLYGTERITVGVGVVNPYTRHPTLFAMDYGVLAEMSRGRAILGIGASVEAWIDQMGLEYRLPRTATKEAIEIARELLAGETCNFRGRAFTVDRVKLSFPVEHRTPMYMAAMGEQTVRTCGEVADGWVVSLLEPIGYIREAMGWLRQGAQTAGRDADAIEVVQYFPLSCNTDSRRAKDAVKPLIALFLAGEFSLYERQKPVMRSLRDFIGSLSPDEYMSLLRELESGADPVTTIPDALVDELSIAGTPEECVLALRRYADAGVTEAALLPAGDPEATALILGDRIRPLLNGGK